MDIPLTPVCRPEALNICDLTNRTSNACINNGFEVSTPMLNRNGDSESVPNNIALKRYLLGRFMGHQRIEYILYMGARASCNFLTF
jgi:hypothetical protein